MAELSRIQKLKLYLVRTKAYRKWFKKNIDEDRINLDVLLERPGMYKAGTYKDDVWEFIPYTLSFQHELSCGTVGCVEGWLRAYPGFKDAYRKGRIADTEDFLGVGDVENTKLFAPRLCDTISQKEEALSRLNHHIQVLKQEIKHEKTVA